jgi:hypothetical protein
VEDARRDEERDNKSGEAHQSGTVQGSRKDTRK